MRGVEGTKGLKILQSIKEIEPTYLIGAKPDNKGKVFPMLN